MIFMDFILTKTGKKVPVYNVFKGQNNLKIQFLEKSLNDVTVDNLRELLNQCEETERLILYTEGGAEQNTYFNYSSLDEFNVKYGFIVQEAIPAQDAQEAVLDEQGNVMSPAQEAKEAVPEVTDNLVTATLNKLSTSDLQIKDIKTDISNLNIGMANLLGV